MCQVIDSIQISAQEDFTHVSILIEGNLFWKKLYNEQIKSSKAMQNQVEWFSFYKKIIVAVNFPIDIYISERSLIWKH